MDVNTGRVLCHECGAIADAKRLQFAEGHWMSFPDGWFLEAVPRRLKDGRPVEGFCYWELVCSVECATAANRRGFTSWVLVENQPGPEGGNVPDPGSTSGV